MSFCRTTRLWFIAPLAVFMVLAGTVRFWDLGSAVLTNDEAYSWRITQYPPAEVVRRTRWDANPPLYYLILQVWEGIWGTSPLALRAFSAVLAVACVPLSYWTCLNALKLAASAAERTAKVEWDQFRSTFWSRGGSLFTAFLLALHASQITQGRTARMYALGVFLAALTSWLLLKVLNGSRPPLVWSSAYGIATAAFALTHNYASFALAAQGLFAGIFLLCQLRRCSCREIGLRAVWLLFAALLGAVLYAPWLPSALGQIAAVREDFWIPELHADEAARVFWPWCTGLHYPDSWGRAGWLLVLLLCLGWTVVRRDLAACFFLAQALVPWFCSLVLSLSWQRSIFYDRYLSFAQWALLGYWGTVCARFPGWPARLLLASFIGASAAASCMWPVADGPPALAQAAEFLKKHTTPGDQIWVACAADLNRLRYYASQVGLSDLWVRCNCVLGQKGHTVHMASLSGEDVLEEDARENPPVRYWTGSEGGGYAASGFEAILEASFQDESSRYTLVLYERAGKGKMGR